MNCFEKTFAVRCVASGMFQENVLQEKKTMTPRNLEDMQVQWGEGGQLSFFETLLELADDSHL